MSICPTSFGRFRSTTALIVLLALALRLIFLNHITLDYVYFLSDWVNVFRENGGFSALRLPIGNYNVPYLYLLAAISYLPVDDLYLIKFFSIAFDFYLAWGCMSLVRHLVPQQPKRHLLTFALVLLLPTVVLNGSAWAQCDSVYTAFCIHAILCALTGRPAPSVLLLACAFSFKLQAVFLLPLWCVFWIARKVKFRHLWLFPLGYFITIVPALLAGKPLLDILGVYWGQAGSDAQHASLNFNSPSVFGFLPHGSDINQNLWAHIAVIAAFILVLAILTLAFLRRNTLSSGTLLLIAAVLAVGVPFLLPYMHERYFFLADVLVLTLACALPTLIPLAVMVQIASLGGYHAYLMGRYLFPMAWGSALMCATLVILLLLWIVDGERKIFPL